jgi:RHS repeat-associated protein
MDAAGVIAYYVMDGNRPLTAESNSNTTAYLYGLGAIGEQNSTWSYGLTDGTNTQRQLTDSLGEVTYSARYTPWGDTLDAFGTGNFTFGYFGGLMDTATGLLYVGDGQYYDPSTGRFLTRNARPNSANPYLPFDPTGAIIGPLGMLALVLGSKKKKSRYDVLLFVLVFAVVTGVALSACGGGGGNDGDGGNGNPPTLPPPSETPHPPTDAPPPTPTQPPPAPTNKPEIDGDCGIPPAIYDYPCTNKDGMVCLKESDSPIVQIAHTIMGEGGNFGDFIAANILQTVVNRAYTYWVVTHHHGINPDNIPWSQINREKLTKLFLYILSEPGGEGWPSYNAWRAPVPRSGVQWQRIIDAVESLLNNAGAPPSSVVVVNKVSPASAIRYNTNVQWYGATTDPKWKPPKNIPVVQIDTITRGDIFCQRQFYTLDSIKPPFEPGKNCP